MKLILSKIETSAVVAMRLYGSERARQAQGIQDQIRALEAQRDAIMSETNENAETLFVAIAEDQGVERIPMDHKFTKLRDGTGTLEWGDGAKPKVLAGGQAVAPETAELLKSGLSDEQLAELATAAPLPESVAAPV